MNALDFIPIIPEDKQYWLVRTQGGRYYRNFKKDGFIAINWDSITYEDIESLSFNDLVTKIKKEYPKNVRPGRTANQLRIFYQVMKPGDIVIITSYASNEFTIGEITEEKPYVEIVPETQLDKERWLCPYQKRRRVKWLKTLHKWDVELKLFKLIQHAQHTITEANNYADLIERHIHNFYIRGDQAYLVLEVKKDGKIPMTDFFRMGTEIINLIEELSQETRSLDLDLNDVDIKVNVSSPGKMTFAGAVLKVTIIASLVVGVLGGGIKIPMPRSTGLDPIEVTINGAIREISYFLDRKQAREHKDLLLKTYMEHLDVKSPDELAKLLQVIESSNEENTSSEK